MGNILFGSKKPSDLSKELKDALSDLKTMDFSDTDYWNNDAIHSYAEKLNIADENFEKLCQNMRDGKVVINSSDDAMAAYSKTVQHTNLTTALATAGTKALSAAMKVLSSIGWMIVITVATELIGKLVNEIDEAIVTTDEAREKSTELTQAWKEESDSLNNLINRYQGECICWF